MTATTPQVYIFVVQFFYVANENASTGKWRGKKKGGKAVVATWIVASIVQ